MERALNNLSYSGTAPRPIARACLLTDIQWGCLIWVVIDYGPLSITLYEQLTPLILGEVTATFLWTWKGTR